jgi:hypothetical protein
VSKANSPSTRSKRREIVERYTVTFGERPECFEEIVFVPYGEDLAEGFALAETLLRRGTTVRIIGLGVTVPGIRPAWVDTARGLALSELWAYRERSTIEATAPLRAGIEDWLDAVFAGAVGDLRGRDVFFSASCLRIFQNAIIAQPDALGIAYHHGADTIHVVGAAWIGMRVLRHLVDLQGGRVVALGGRKGARLLPWPLKIGALGGAAFVATVVDQAGAFLKSSPTRRAIRELRSRSSVPTPDTWIVLIADWFRFNRQLIHSVAIPELARGKKLGILLAGSLIPGARSEAVMRERVGHEIWTGIGELQSRLDECVVDQLVGAETGADLTRALARALAASASAVWRLARYGRRVGTGATEIDLGPHAFELAKLATLDVARAIQAQLATQNILRRHRLDGQSIVMATSSNAEMITAAFVMHAAGATTVELAHGSIGTGEPGARQSKAQRLCVWTHADARTLEPFDQTCIVAGMPRLATSARNRTQTTVERVLFLSNYVHRGYLMNGRLPLEPVQLEMLRAAAGARRALGPGAEIRWRPHPADDDESIARTLATVRDVERSVGRNLHDDVTWADVIVCSPSSTLFEVMLAGVPVFLHLTPDYAETPASDFVAPSRTFFRAEELEPKLTACVEALRRGDPEALAPERDARFALLGPTGEPIALHEALLDEVRPERRASR